MLPVNFFAVFAASRQPAIAVGPVIVKSGELTRSIPAFRRNDGPMVLRVTYVI